MEDVFLYDWLIHLAGKTWITAENVGQLNTAFFFALDYFQNEKPIGAKDASVYQTLYIQKQMIERRKTVSPETEGEVINFANINRDELRRYRNENPIRLL